MRRRRGDDGRFVILAIGSSPGGHVPRAPRRLAVVLGPDTVLRNRDVARIEVHLIFESPADVVATSACGKDARARRLGQWGCCIVAPAQGSESDATSAQYTGA